MRIHDRIYMSSTFGRTYIVACGDAVAGGAAAGADALVMIDTFTSRGVREALREFAEEDGLDLGRLRALLLTHMHFDHAAGAAYVRATHSVPVVCHPLDGEALVVGFYEWDDRRRRDHGVGSSPVSRKRVSVRAH